MVNLMSKYSIVHISRVKMKLLCHRKMSQVTDGPVPNIPVPYSHRYWAIPHQNSDELKSSDGPGVVQGSDSEVTTCKGRACPGW